MRRFGSWFCTRIHILGLHHTDVPLFYFRLIVVGKLDIETHIF
jgi:hypothetical protein